MIALPISAHDTIVEACDEQFYEIILVFSHQAVEIGLGLNVFSYSAERRTAFETRLILLSLLDVG